MGRGSVDGHAIRVVETRLYRVIRRYRCIGRYLDTSAKVTTRVRNNSSTVGLVCPRIVLNGDGYALALVILCWEVCTSNVNLGSDPTLSRSNN